MQNQIRIVLVDKHKLLFSSIELAINQTDDLRLLGMSSTEEEAFGLCIQYAPKVLLLST